MTLDQASQPLNVIYSEPDPANRQAGELAPHSSAPRPQGGDLARAIWKTEFLFSRGLPRQAVQIAMLTAGAARHFGRAAKTRQPERASPRRRGSL